MGVVNPRTPDVETVEQVVARVREALHYIPESRLFLNPDCGFGTFAQRPMNNAGIATEKLKVIVEAAERLRHGG